MSSYIQQPTRRVALLFDRIAGYQCQVLMGIHRYVRENTDWQCFGLSPSLALIPELKPLQLHGIIGILNTSEIGGAVAALQLPLINVSNFVSFPHIARVGVDEFAVGRMIAEHLLDRGFRTMAYVPHSTGMFSRERQAGFMATLQEAGINESHVHIYEKGLTSRFWQGSCDPELKQWIQNLPRPVGIFASNDALAMKVVDEAHRTGRQIPEDIAIIGVDNSELHCELMRPRLSSVVQPAARIGYEAAMLLENLMNGEPNPTRPLLLQPTRIVCRESTDVLAIQDHTLAKVIGYIRSHATKKISIHDLVEQTGWSRRKLEDRFRFVLHRTPHEEITRVRLDTAKLLLQTTDMPVSEIAVKSGFTNATRLSQVFQKELGIPPTQFRSEQVRHENKWAFHQ